MSRWILFVLANARCEAYEESEKCAFPTPAIHCYGGLVVSTMVFILGVAGSSLSRINFMLILFLVVDSVYNIIKVYFKTRS